MPDLSTAAYPPYTLRITQSSEGANIYRIELSFEAADRRQARQAVTVRLDAGQLRLIEAVRQNLRWYFEDYLQYPAGLSRQQAQQVQQSIEQTGTRLFETIFYSTDDARNVVANMLSHLHETRIEIVTEVQEASAVPWEMLREPKTLRPLALEAHSFVRAQPASARSVQLPEPGFELRVLLVICRPGGAGDVPFRSVATQLVTEIGYKANVRLESLRPPTFEQLGQVLRDARIAGKPYHIVHFDGHGVYGEGIKAVTVAEPGRQPLLFGETRPGEHGYLLFENNASPDNTELIPGYRLGDLLREAGVGLLVLNACRSASAAQPGDANLLQASNVHQQVRGFGSLAQEIMDSGVAGVVAMRYNVYVNTASQFMRELYSCLHQGLTLGQSVTLGRKKLADQPLREVASGLEELQDWPVPVVYEATPYVIVQKEPSKVLIVAEDVADHMIADRLDAQLPPPPDIGFYGRNETMLGLDRAFDACKIVLLHGAYGSGKKTTAAEYARWFAYTGGIDDKGMVLYTTINRQHSLPEVLDTLAQRYARQLADLKLNWLSLGEAERRTLALKLMQLAPALWVWNDVELIGMSWSTAAQQELADFLRAATGPESRMYFLLLSRRDEREWLGELPRRLELLPMPMPERMEIAQALARRMLGQNLTAINDWKPLLIYSQGNPLALTKLLGQAMQEKLQTRAEIEGFVTRLLATRETRQDSAPAEAEEPLKAAYLYALENEFNEHEREQLSRLYLFQGLVDVRMLEAMGRWGEVPSMADLTYDEATALLDRTVKAGLLLARGDGLYEIQPSMANAFKILNNRYSGLSSWVAAVSSMSSYFAGELAAGDQSAALELARHEPNLLQARRTALDNQWWPELMRIMEGLRMLYRSTQRNVEWSRLVESLFPEMRNPVSGQPQPGREGYWNTLLEWQKELA